eukprot:6936969-Prymnesium_polylepis.1
MQKARAGEQRAAARSKAKQTTKTAVAKLRAEHVSRMKESRTRVVEKARVAAEAAAAAETAKLRARVAAARKRARAKESAAKRVPKLLSRAKQAEAKVWELQAELDEMEADESGAELDEEAEPQTLEGSRRDARGRFKADDWRLRPMEWAQLSRRVPPGMVGGNVRDVLRVFAPEVQYAEPTEREMRARRVELTIAGECMANYRVGKAKRIISFGFDESTKFGQGLLSTNTQIEPHDAPGTSVDVVQRGCTLTAGGSAEAIAKSIDTNIFSYGRLQLTGWKATHTRKFGAASWAEEGAPEPESLGMHR